MPLFLLPVHLTLSASPSLAEALADLPLGHWDSIGERLDAEVQLPATTVNAQPLSIFCRASRRQQQ